MRIKHVLTNHKMRGLYDNACSPVIWYVSALPEMACATQRKTQISPLTTTCHRNKNLQLTSCKKNYTLQQKPY